MPSERVGLWIFLTDPFSLESDHLKSALLDAIYGEMRRPRSWTK
jgi:hypothetical protein